MVERRGAFEHLAHIRDVVDPPVVQRLVERRGSVEHTVHRRNARGIPRADVVVEGRSLRHAGIIVRVAFHPTLPYSKQPRHVRDLACIPRRDRRQALVEAVAPALHPVSQRLVRERRALAF